MFFLFQGRKNWRCEKRREWRRKALCPLVPKGRSGSEKGFFSIQKTRLRLRKRVSGVLPVSVSGFMYIDFAVPYVLVYTRFFEPKWGVIHKDGI